ncbi:MAG: Crp/Fnr family transcriptional regulator [Treponemataceae bacterium]
MKECSLFDNLDDEQIVTALRCIHAKVEKIEKNEDIFANRGVKLGILLYGRLQNVQIDYFGNQNIIANFLPSELFGEALVCANIKKSPINLVATEKSSIMFLDYTKILGVCNNACVFHLMLIKNMLTVLAKKNIFLNRKLQHLTKRSTREKLLSYLTEQSRSIDNNSFSIPFNRQELADYLSVERSALSAELSKLRKDGLLDFHKNEFKLKIKS